MTRAIPDACATPSRRTKSTVNQGTRQPKAGRLGLGTWKTSTQAATSSLTKQVAVPVANDKARDCPVSSRRTSGMVPPCHKSLALFLLVLSACISTRWTRLPVCQRLEQEYTKETINSSRGAQKSKRQWCQSGTTPLKSCVQDSWVQGTVPDRH